MMTIVGNRGQLWTSTLSPHFLSPRLDKCAHEWAHECAHEIAHESATTGPMRVDFLVSRAAKRGGFKRGGFPIWTCPSFFFSPFWDFPNFSGIFPICSGMVWGFSRFVLLLYPGLLRAPTRNSPERVRDIIWTFPEKMGSPPVWKPPGLASLNCFHPFQDSHESSPETSHEGVHGRAHENVQSIRSSSGKPTEESEVRELSGKESGICSGIPSLRGFV